MFDDCTGEFTAPFFNQSHLLGWDIKNFAYYSEVIRWILIILKCDITRREYLVIIWKSCQINNGSHLLLIQLGFSYAHNTFYVGWARFSSMHRWSKLEYRAWMAKCAEHSKHHFTKKLNIHCLKVTILFAIFL